MKRIFLIVFAIFSLVECVVAQDGNNTSYLLPNLPQRYRLNPAYQPEYKVFIGLPGLSGISVNYLNSSFTIEDLLFKKQDSVYMDINKFHSSLRKRNFISFDNENSIFSLGIKVNSWYATLDIVQKNEFLFRYNKDIFTFLKYGNADYPNMDFGKLGVNLNSYLEVAFGLSKRVNDKLVVGGRLKYLMGVANAHMTDSDLSVTTNDDGTMRLHSRQNIKVSAPFKIQDKETNLPFPEYQPIDWDNFDFDTDDLSVSDFLHTRNPGFAIDLGGEYKLNERINLFASLTDLGFIRWGNDDYNYTFYQNTTFLWEGADISNSINKDHNDNYKELDDAFDDLVDSLKDNFRLSRKGGSYTTMLNPKLSLGATYQLNKTFNVGGVLRAFLVNKMFLPSLTASLNARLCRNISAAVSYNMARGSYVNVGAAVTAKLGPFQLYVATDNVLAANYTNVQSASGRFGINLLFGHKDHKKKSKVEEEPVEVIVAPVPVKKDTVQRDTTPMPEVDPVTPMMEEKVSDTESVQVKACYVIVGSFRSKNRAEALRKRLAFVGFESSTILVNESGMYRVAAAAFENRTDCWNEVFRIRKQYPQYADAWGLTVLQE